MKCADIPYMLQGRINEHRNVGKPYLLELEVISISSSHPERIVKEGKYCISRKRNQCKETS